MHTTFRGRFHSLGLNMHRGLRLVMATLALVALFNGTMVRAQEDDDELSPGLHASIRIGDVTTDRSIESVVFPTTSFTTTSDFEFAASGQLLIQHEGATQWHVFGQGHVEIEIAGRKVLDHVLDEHGGFTTEDATSRIGLQPLKVRLTPAKGRAGLQVYWSSSQFQLEPLPAHLLFKATPSAESQHIETGRRLFAAYRCGQCHAADPDAIRLEAPDLRFTSQLNRDWLEQQLRGTHAKARMPQFGLKPQEIADVTAFLTSKSLQPALDKLPNPDKKRTNELDRADGLVLLKSTGCLACHVWQEVGQHGEFGGADLSAIGSKRSTEWFFTWLSDPEKLNPAHRMPVFRLSPLERRQLALALSSLQSSAVEKEGDLELFRGQTRRGQELLSDARCLACHNLPGVDKPVLKSIPALTQPVRDWQASCLSETPDRTSWRPSFRFRDVAEVTSLKAYVTSLSKPRLVPTLVDRGRAVIEAKNCLACHPRGTSKGLATITKSILATEPSLAAFAPTLVAPNLTAIGDKLLDEALQQSIAGEQTVRKPWLKVRMPKFKHSDSDRSAIASYFVTHDRIPERNASGQVLTTALSEKLPPVDDQTLLLGQTLVGPRGFGCIACHQMGSYLPKNVAIGTRGSDLLTLRSRLREPFFHRWVHAPIRVVPGMEMPSYGTRPIKGVLGDDPQQQIATLWRTLNDARFQAPTDIGSVEQLVFVEANQPARVIRDVFTNPEINGGGYISRSFAVGFENQHNLLFDLDSLTVRGWTFGDLARQRTVGKSWYWDLAGSAIVPQFLRESDYFLVDQIVPDAQPVPPTKANGTVGRLVSYRPYQQGIEFVFDLNFTLNGIPNTVRVMEQLLPRRPTDPKSQRAGVDRRVTVHQIPTGFGLMIARPKLNGLNASWLGQPTIQRVDETNARWRDLPPTMSLNHSAAREVSAVATIDGSATATLIYEATLQAPSLAVVGKPTLVGQAQRIESMPGFDGVQLPLPTSIMPTAMTVLNDGTLAIASLKGHVYLTRDANKDGLPDALQLFEEGLAAPYGLIEELNAKDAARDESSTPRLLVAHKPEVLRLRDTDGDGRVDERTVFATGWGYNDNYHDWTCGIIRDSRGDLFVGTGSDYSQPGRPKDVSRWRGKVLKIAPNGEVTPFAHAFRYPTGLAIDARDRIFVSDNQGEQNCFNEINHIRENGRYGVESLHERQPPVDPGQPPAIQVPHPWTRSVNGLVILPSNLDGPAAAWAGQGVGCEYNTRFLVRFTYQEVDGVMQGAIFPFSKPNYADVEKSFLGPLSIAVSSRGEIYVGSIHDSGWLGGLNVGSIVKLTAKSIPPGLKDIRASNDGFELSFFLPVDAALATKAEHYSLSGYTRVWQGTYETPDSGRYQPTIQSVTVSPDQRTARLKVDRLKTGFVYEFNCPKVFGTEEAWPTSGSYTLHRQPSQ